VSSWTWTRRTLKARTGGPLARWIHLGVLLQAATGEPQAAELGDDVDDADRRNAEQTGMAVDQLLQTRWAALQQASEGGDDEPAPEPSLGIRVEQRDDRTR
jgi:hypothetical protein